MQELEENAKMLEALADSITANAYDELNITRLGLYCSFLDMIDEGLKVLEEEYGNANSTN